MAQDLPQDLYGLLARGFPKDRTRTALELLDGTCLSYADLETETARYANLFRRLGVKPGDRVAVQAEKSAAALFLYLGVIRAGAAYLPLNTAYQRGEIGYFLQDAEPRVFVCDPSSVEAFEPLAKAAGVVHVLTLDGGGHGTAAAAARAETPAAETHPAKAEDLAAILYTSGTTGRSKGAMMPHRALTSNAATLHRLWGFKPDDVLLHALPIFHTHGLFVACSTALLNGSPILFLPKFEADAVIERLVRATVFMGVPTFYTRLLQSEGLTRAATAKMRLFVSGSAPLLTETWNAFKERTGHAILERYGMTETGMNSSNPYEGERRPGSVGLPLPDVSIRIADASGNPLPDGQIGQIEIKGPNLFKGYWRMPEKTASEFRPDGYFISGDLAVRGADGYITIVGRAKDLIISGGFNVYPKEVETVIDAVPGVIESAVFGVPHPDFGEAVLAVVTADKVNDTKLPETIISVVKKELANYKVPKRVIVLDSLPRNAMGKVEKAKLRATYQAIFAA